MISGRNKILVLLAVVTAVLASCSAGKDNPGRIYMPDMAFSNAYEAYSENRITADSFQNMIHANASARTPDHRSVPFGFLPDDIEKRNDDAYMKSYMFKNYFANWNFDPESYQENYDRAGAEVKNPLEYNEANLAEGKRLYNIQCAVCHGDKGAGDGSIVILKDDKGNEIGEGPYTAIPPAYTDRLPGLSDGNIFYSVTFGKNMMGGYAHALNVEERWQVIMYIKDLAGMSPGSDAVVPNAAEEAEADAEDIIEIIEDEVEEMVDMPDISAADNN